MARELLVSLRSEDGDRTLTPNQQEIERALRLFVPDEQLSFLFAKNFVHEGNHPRNYGGYFLGDQVEEIARKACELSSSADAVYFHPNPIKSNRSRGQLGTIEPLCSGGSVKTTDVEHKRWLLIDVDPTRPADCGSTVSEHHLAHHLIADLQAIFLDQWNTLPIVADTGNGFHLLFRTDLTVDCRLPHTFLKKLSNEFTTNEVKIDTSVAKPNQLFRLYGTLNRKGVSTDARPHRLSRIISIPETLQIVGEEELRLICGQDNQSSSLGNVYGSDQTYIFSLTERINRARAYLLKLPPAISGQGGHHQTFAAARALCQGFSLARAEAMTLIREYNQRCQPSWTDPELEHNIDDASVVHDSNKTGYLLRKASHQLSGPVFPFEVPEVLPLPATVALQPLIGADVYRSRGRPPRNCVDAARAMLGLFGREQRRTYVVIPDHFVAAVVCGANPHSRWRTNLKIANSNWYTIERRRRMTNQLETLNSRKSQLLAEGRHPATIPVATLVDKIGETEQSIHDSFPPTLPPQDCPSLCPLHESGRRHQHFAITNVQREPVYAELREADNQADASYPGQQLSFDLRNDEGERLVDELIKSSRYYYAYLPLELFATASGLCSRRRRLLQGIYRELTRSAAQRQGSVSSHLRITNARVAGRSGNGARICPFLETRDSYAVFGGNRRNRVGRGYQPLTFSGWLGRFGYAIEEGLTDQNRRHLLIALDDMEALRSDFSLTFAALGNDGSWTDLAEFTDRVRTNRKSTLLARSQIRIYVPFDFRVRWRKWFASKLGYSYIPGGDWSQPTGAVEDSENSASGPQLKSRLKKRNIKQRQIADSLGWSPGTVSRQLNGTSTLSEELRRICLERLSE